MSEATVLSASRKLEERAISGPAPCLLSCTFPAAQLSSPRTVRTDPPVCALIKSLSEAPADFSSELSSHQMAIRATRGVFVRAGLPSNLSEFDAQLAHFSFYLSGRTSICVIGDEYAIPRLWTASTHYGPVCRWELRTLARFFPVFQQVELPGPVFATCFIKQGPLRGFAAALSSVASSPTCIASLCLSLTTWQIVT